VFRLVPEDKHQLQALRDLEEQVQGVSWGQPNIRNKMTSIEFLQVGKTWRQSLDKFF
jgi:hypothetical protein